MGNLPIDFRSAKTVEKQEGRWEERTIAVNSLLNAYLGWSYLEQVFNLERRFTNLSTGETEYEVQYGLTSLPAQQATPERLLTIVRSE